MLRRFVAATALGMAIALLLVSTLTAQTNYKVPRLPDGHPDFQGFWNNTTYTPLERPKGIDREFFTKEEVVEQMKRAAAEESEQTTPGTVAIFASSSRVRAASRESAPSHDGSFAKR